MIGEETIKSQYNKTLAFSYGDKESLIKKVNKGLILYKKAKNKRNPKIKHRIELYTKIVEYAKHNK